MKRLGKYDLLRVLGRGATATVYLAHDPFADRQVAIKLASPEALRDPDSGRLYTRQFINEAALAGRLEHPHIAQIYDAVVDDTHAYIVMEYVAGGTLEPHCQSNHRLPLSRIIEIAFKCSRALDFACRQGIIHRDIKPANLLLTQAESGSDQPVRNIPAGDLKISDFGAALSISSDATQITGIGSPAYMSPQQVREEALDHRTDIYSLGVVMYQLLAGQLPFQASNQYNMIYQVVNADPTPLASLRPDLPPAVVAVVERAMAKTLEARYPTWEALSRDLTQLARRERLARERPRDADPAPADSAREAESEKFDSLRELAFFAEFSDVELWEVLRFARWAQHPAGTTIIHEGDPGDFFSFLLSGRLEVSKQGRILDLLTEGDCFGEMAIIGEHDPSRPRRRGADVCSLTPVHLVEVPGRALLTASSTCRMHFYQGFLRVLTSRLSLANQRLTAY